MSAAIYDGTVYTDAKPCSLHGGTQVKSQKAVP